MSTKTFEAERIHFLSGVLVAVAVVFAYASYYYRVFSHDVTAAILVSQNNAGGHVGVPNQSCGS